MKDKDKGFTLIELLVVIVIIGILAAIAIPLFLNQRKKGVDSSLKSDVKSAATAVETWMVDNPSTHIVVGTAVGPAKGTANSSIAAFTASDGNTVKLTKTAVLGEYCISASNEGSSEPTKFIKYLSDAGGLQKEFTTTCA
jgi:prepilin-type N-terminal cleavage/methylation domain-containing protein